MRDPAAPGSPARAATPLADGRLLARNTGWNLAGLGLPLVAGLAAIPPLVAHLGVARFGVLTLAWMVIGYFSLFDLGLGRAVTKLAAERIGSEREAEIPLLAWTALLLMGLLGLAAVPLVAGAAPWLVEEALRIPAELQGESVAAFYWMALSIPFVIGTTGLRGLLEAQQRFKAVNALRIPMGLFNFLGPLAVLPFSVDLGTICAVLAAGRVVAWAAHLRFCTGLLGGRPRFDRALVRPLVGFGGWMTVSNVVGPVMMYLDRFVIGALLSVAAVAYYATPYEMVTKLLILPGALAGVLFPALAAALASDRRRAARLFERGIWHLFIALFLPVLAIVTFADELLALWLNADFAHHSARVLQWLAVGVLANGLAHLPLALVHGSGRPDLSAKVHLAELALYLPALWWLLPHWGIDGVAALWALRTTLDALIFFLLTRRLLPATGGRLRSLATLSALAATALALAASLVSPAAKALFFATAAALFAALAWHRLLGPDERGMIKRAFRLQSA